MSLSTTTLGIRKLWMLRRETKPVQEKMPGTVFEFLQRLDHQLLSLICVAGSSEGKGKILVCGTRDHLDVFPQSIVNPLA